MALKVTDDMRVYSTDEETCLRQSAGNWLIVVTGAFHNDACFSIKILDQPSKRSKVRRKVRHIKRLLNYLSAGTEDCNCTLPFGNIYTYCVHIHKMSLPVSKIAIDQIQLYSLPIQSTVV